MPDVSAALKSLQSKYRPSHIMLIEISQISTWCGLIVANRMRHLILIWVIWFLRKSINHYNCFINWVCVLKFTHLSQKSALAGRWPKPKQASQDPTRWHTWLFGLVCVSVYIRFGVTVRASLHGNTSRGNVFQNDISLTHILWQSVRSLDVLVRAFLKVRIFLLVFRMKRGLV